uniref:ARAD1C20768p n=1 Tax=Blastobotrys adeninivorans TaxID=409370 RepID=A0A060T125_BLAAD
MMHKVRFKGAHLHLSILADAFYEPATDICELICRFVLACLSALLPPLADLGTIQPSTFEWLTVDCRQVLYIPSRGPMN